MYAAIVSQTNPAISFHFIDQVWWLFLNFVTRKTLLDASRKTIHLKNQQPCPLCIKYYDIDNAIVRQLTVNERLQILRQAGQTDHSTNW